MDPLSPMIRIAEHSFRVDSPLPRYVCQYTFAKLCDTEFPCEIEIEISVKAVLGQVLEVF